MYGLIKAGAIAEFSKTQQPGYLPIANYSDSLNLKYTYIVYDNRIEAHPMERTLDEVKEAIALKIREEQERRLAAIEAGREKEAKTWTRKASDVEKWRESGTLPEDSYLALEAASAGIPLAQLVAITEVALLEIQSASARTTGWAIAWTQAVNAATDIEGAIALYQQALEDA